MKRVVISIGQACGTEPTFHTVLRHGWDGFQFTLQSYDFFLIYTKKIALAGAIFLSGAWCSMSYSL